MANVLVHLVARSKSSATKRKIRRTAVRIAENKNEKP